MARLDFDFHLRSARPGKLGIALALAGVVTLGWVWAQMQAARAGEAGLALQIAVLEQAQPAVAARPAIRVDTPEKTAQARIESQLAYSWQPAFEALATAHSSKIALLALDAVQSKSQIKLMAEARQLSDAVEFIQSLQQQPGIRHVALTQHEVQADDPEKPVRFTVLLGVDG